MKFKIILLIPCLLFSMLAFSQKQPYIWNGSNTMDTLFTYDKKGNIITVQCPGSKNDYANQITHFEYDRKGRLRKKYSRDTLGNIISEPNEPSFTTYKYKKKKGNKILITTCYDKDMKPDYFMSLGYHAYKIMYDKRGNKIEDWTFTDKGEIRTNSRYTHDEENRLIEKQNLDREGKLIRTYYAFERIEYDEQGREIKRYYLDYLGKPTEGQSKAHLVETDYHGVNNQHCTREYDKELQPLFTSPKLLEEPYDALDLEYLGTDRKIKYKLSDLKGKVIILDFWASWCRPCRMNNPTLVALYDKYKDQGLEIFSVSLDKDLGKWKKAIKDDNLYWENHISDLKQWRSQPAKDYKVNSIPRIMIIDRKGKVVIRNVRGFCSFEEILLQLL